MALQRVPINNFRGGLNVRDSPFELQPNESPDLLNVTISALVGQLEQRKGKTRVDVSGLPEERVDHAKQVVIGNEKRFLMLSINGSLWYMNPAGEVKKLFKGTAGTIWDFVVFSDVAYKDWVWTGNGVDKMQKWDGEAAGTVEWKIGGLEAGKGGILEVWENRLFLSGIAAFPQRIYFSEFADPEGTIKEYGFVDVRGSEEDLDAIQGLHVLGARLFVLKRRSVFYISSAVTMLNRRVGGPGMFARFQCVELEEKLYFFNPQGIFSTGGVSVAMESGSINSYFPKNLNKAALAEVHVVATKDTYPRLLVAVPTGSSTTPDILIEVIPHINFRRIGGRRYLLLPAFMLHTIPATCLACWNPTGTEEMVVGGTTVGLVTNTFLSVPTLDTWQRSESPLSNEGKWVKWAWSASTGVCTAVAPTGWVVNSPNKLEGGRWTVEEFTGASLEFEVFSWFEAPAIGASYSLDACFDLASMTGYTTRWEIKSLGSSKETLVTIEKWLAGVKTLLGEATIHLPQSGNFRLGFTVAGGKLRAWVNIAGNGWELVKEVANAAYSKGYVGFENFHGGTVTLRNFKAAGYPASTSRLSRLFDSTTDEGQQIEAHWHSSWMAIQGEEPRERIRRLNVELQGDAIVDVFTDFEAIPRFSAPLEKAPEAGEPYRFTRVRPETRGRFHAVRFRSLPDGEPFLINVAELVIRGGKEH